MGWGYPKKDRQVLLGEGAMLSKGISPAGRAEVFDMNAGIRMHARPGVSPQQVTSQLLRVASSATVARVFAMFDRPKAMPAMRASLHASRYRGSSALDPGVVEAHCAQLGPGVHHLPARKTLVDYKALFTPGPVKKLAFDLFAEAAWHEFTVRQRPGVHAEVYYPDGTTGVVGKNGSPGTHSAAVAHLGEADLSAFEVAAREAGAGRPVVIRSVDTDLILQTVAYGMLGLRAFVPTKPFLLRLKGGTVDGRHLVARFGGDDPSDRLSAAFWMIMAGGTDYSKPASDQGYYKKDMADLALRRTRAFTVSPARKVTFNVSTTQGILALLRRRKTKKPSARSMKAALYEAARSAAYYGGYNPHGTISADWGLSSTSVAL